VTTTTTYEHFSLGSSIIENHIHFRVDLECTN